MISPTRRRSGLRCARCAGAASGRWDADERIGRVSGDRSVTVCEVPVHDDGVWAWWVLGGVVAWLFVGTAVALLLGSMIRLADRREGLQEDIVRAEAVAPVLATRTLRRRIPLSPLGVGLVLTATGLMVSGYVVRLSGSTGPTAQLLSMDAPFSLPRMFVAATFAAAALAALAGAGRIPGRRTWWTAVGVVAAGIAAVKAGSSGQRRDQPGRRADRQRRAGGLRGGLALVLQPRRPS